MFGKRVEVLDLEKNNRGFCTAFCPSSCKSTAVVYCKCSNDKYENRGSSYSTWYAKQHMNFLAPDWD
ncbi:hypothetical protein [Terrisporobacter muris]|uniref:Uncharacterized protein n=1 Tax=Terrisporobacter muris TaxID=2963284 RepID=A0A9X2S340_9FIRM|nr:hypothetical protein [Terrisporobacter muris]MCR1824683.1 hypothetical protein [Terrisporobacter muris]